jgi:hypothetical protein
LIRTSTTRRRSSPANISASSSTLVTSGETMKPARSMSGAARQVVRCPSAVVSSIITG